MTSVEPFWRASVMHDEPLFFVAPRQAGSGPVETIPAARLLFPPREPVSLTSVDGATAYEPDRDFIVDLATGLVTLPPGSRVPFTHHAELYPACAPSSELVMHTRHDPGTCLLWSDAIFHSRQALATYAHQPGVWRGYAPASERARLPATTRRLRDGASLTVCLAGDSISEGYNASGYMRQPPYQAPYGELVARGLEAAHGSPIVFHNRAVAGHTTDNGVWEMEELAAHQPDLVIVAYGMNDAGYLEASGFARNIARLIADVRHHAPHAEFVLVSSMLPHPEWDYPAAGRFAAYRDALAALCGGGIVLADLTAMWTDLLERKSSLDLSGNGINHPNDFGHRVYAQVILALLT